MSSQEERAMKLNALAIGLATGLSGSAWASETYCGVSKPTADGFVVLRQGPSPAFAPEGSVTPSDFLYLDTAQCRSDFGKLRCSRNGAWVFVEKVAGSTKKGWANAKLVRSIACPDEMR